MKKLLSLLLVSASLSAFACGGYGDLYPKWSIGVIGYGISDMPVTGQHGYFLPGVQFTHQDPFGKWGQRVAIEYTRQFETTPDFPPNGADMLSTEGKENRVLLRVGVERGWYLHRLFRPYVAMDLGFQFGKSDMSYSGGIAGMHHRYETSTKGIGLMPVVGFRTYIGKRISVYAEYRAEAFVNDVDTKITDYFGHADYRPTSETEFEFVGGRILQAGVHVMF